jgi:hypothetical protein
MVSYLWPVISSAALRLPRRITTRRVRATSAGVTRKRYIAVPRVGPNERPQFRQTQRGRPPLLPFFRSLPHGWPHSEGRGGSGNWAFDSSGPPPSESGPDDTTEHYSGERLPTKEMGLQEGRGGARGLQAHPPEVGLEGVPGGQEALPTG